ncbi:winged helix-turn-helix domain-containing tetratricopeptide repeat protein [Ovoidimarina sediminis]|uniref:winged helix-turn-helix domain-containing tetratricopeptide repeat protein n=1 Tax=Ovoidimarina sediminis TaxID=3079856 RepID=UPI00290AE0BA|nr:winged helix-turn-helix domain-containing protein [Rhodophyticola sp. MJ-SS7]MDU8945194.1 winged helix-turn-helix domain-containing protein [Rhodophyticola sp. MJ-SS7]
MKIYEFHQKGLVLDGSDGSLRRHTGEAVELRPQSREVPAHLARAPGRTVSREEFTEAVWDGRQVSDDSLVQCIAEIRSALGDHERNIIQTVPRKGYRFVPPDGAQRQGAGRRRALLPAAAVVVLVAVVVGFGFWPQQQTSRAPVVAVLPLDDLSAAPHQGYLNDALAEGIITELARFPQFRVIARNSSFQFREAPTDVREIGATLGAGYVVEGSQQFDGARIKVTVQLVETDTGAHLFSDRYERDLDDLFAVQNEIVRHIASVTGQSILSDMPVHAAEDDVDSRLRGLQARNHMTNLTRENWQKAMALEETSIREEPHSAWGYVGKGLMLGVGARLGWLEPREDVLAEAKDHAETALRLAPENYMSHYTLARILSWQGEYAESLLHFARASDLNPSDSIVLIGMSIPLLYTGETEQAIDVLQQAAKVDPLHGDWLRWQLGWAYWQNDECERGLEAMQSMASPPVASNKTLASLLVCLGREEEAKVALQRFLDTRPGYSREDEAKTIPIDWKPDGLRDRFLEDMRRAGMP